MMPAPSYFDHNTSRIKTANIIFAILGKFPNKKIARISYSMIVLYNSIDCIAMSYDNRDHKAVSMAHEKHHPNSLIPGNAQ